MAVVDSFTSHAKQIAVTKIAQDNDTAVEIEKKDTQDDGLGSLLEGAKDLFNSFWPSENAVGEKENEVDIITKEKETIHIMSVASGHLYERFLKIMMLSVLEHSTSPVKFWFIKQFLSPKFKNEFVPAFSKAYNCEIELVTYRWPEWLREQTEKQRIIWAYKILFFRRLISNRSKTNNIC
eukprot:UN27718